MEPNLNQDGRQAHALLDVLPAEKLNAALNQEARRGQNVSNGGERK